jgi:toxin-antitoxin system PIN domain toxin
MRFLIDTNILLHAVNPDSPAHQPACQFLKDHLAAGTSWCTTWPILYEFLRVSTHNRVFPKPLKAAQAFAFVRNLASRDEVGVLTPTERHIATLENIIGRLSHPSGNLFHDIHTAVLMREHGVHEIITADTDFLQFDFLKVTNPLRL